MMRVTKTRLGTLPSGEEAALWTLESGTLSFSLTDYGASWTALTMPDTQGRRGDVLLGFSTPEEWAGNTLFMNATIGRFANRIAGASFSLRGKTYCLDKNNGNACLHGGAGAFHKVLWKGEAFERAGGVFVRFERESPAGEGGFPGHVKAAVTYGLRAENAVHAEYEAQASEDCPLSLTNHAYFNLAARDSGGILAHHARIHASYYAELNEARLPTGRLLPVDETPFDFRQMREIGSRQNGGYDVPFALDGPPGVLRPAAEIHEPRSGRSLALLATQPALQFYTGGNIASTRGKGAALYTKHSGFCLETEYFPDSPNQKTFPSAIFGPGRNYHEEALFSFNV